MLDKNTLIRIANVFSTQLFTIENKKIEQYGIKAMRISKGKLDIRQILKLNQTKAGEKAAIFRNQLLSLRITKLITLFRTYDINDLDDLQNYLEELNQDPQIARIQHKIDKWEKYETIASLRQKPENSIPPNDENTANVSLRLQNRYIFSDNIQHSVIINYLELSDSSFGKLIREFRDKLDTKADIEHEIPQFLESIRSKFSTLFQDPENIPDFVPALDFTSLHDFKYHKDIHEVQLLEIISQSFHSITPEHIELSFEKYFYAQCGEKILERIKDASEDAIIEQKYKEFENISPFLLGIKPQTVHYSIKFFDEPIKLLKHMSEVQNPTSKLISIFLAIENILKNLSKHKTVGVDDITDPLLYCVIQAKIPNIISQMKLIQLFVNSRLMKTAFGAHFTSLLSVVHRLKTLNLSELKKQIKILIPVLSQTENSIKLEKYRLNILPPLIFKDKMLPVIAIETEDENDKIYVKKYNIEDVGEHMALISRLNFSDFTDIQIGDAKLYIKLSETDTIPFKDANDYHNIITRFILHYIDNLSPSEPIEEHLKTISKLYGIQCDTIESAETLIISRLSYELHEFGLLNDFDYHTCKFDHNFYKSYKNFAREFISHENKVEFLTPSFCNAIHNTFSVWVEAITIKPIIGDEAVHWKVPVMIMQFLSGIPLTRYFDSNTRAKAATIFNLLSMQQKISVEDKFSLQKVI